MELIQKHLCLVIVEIVSLAVKPVSLVENTGVLPVVESGLVRLDYEPQNSLIRWAVVAVEFVALHRCLPLYWN